MFAFEVAYIRRIRGLGKMGVDTKTSPVGLGESPENVFSCLVDVCAASVFREVVDQRDLGELLLEDVDFVKEENDGCAEEPPGVDD